MALTASWMERNSFRSCSRVWASRKRADFVRALGAMLTLEFGPNRRFSKTGWLGWSRAGDAVLDGMPSDVPDRGVSDADMADSAFCSLSSSSSPPNDNFPLTACFRFFFGGCGVETLCFDYQSLPFANLVPCIKECHEINQETYPSLGVAAPDVEAGVAVVKRPKLPPWASRSFCSSASARRLRKSDRWTRPTVWDFKRSSAVDACDVKREFGGGFGVEMRDGALEEGVDEAIAVSGD